MALINACTVVVVSPTPARWICADSMLPSERKSIEPMAARVHPEDVCRRINGPDETALRAAGIGQV